MIEHQEGGITFDGGEVGLARLLPSGETLFERYRLCPQLGRLNAAAVLKHPRVLGRRSGIDVHGLRAGGHFAKQLRPRDAARIHAQLCTLRLREESGRLIRKDPQPIRRQLRLRAEYDHALDDAVFFACLREESERHEPAAVAD